MTVETAQEPSGAQGAQSPEHSRQRSTIGFPYDDLDASIELVTAIHQNVGHGECDDDQLAAWTGQSSKSSGFRTKIYAARMFGVIDGENGKHRLTETGRSIVDPQQTREARAKAFLNVPLYGAIYENHKGGVLPPLAALEREMTGLGVAEKQKGRARQVFERSAEQAAFFEHGRGRLIMPGVQRSGPNKASEKPSGGVVGSGGGGSGGGGGGKIDAVVSALIDKLPATGPWPVEDRVMWLQMLSMAFQLAYGSDGTIEIKKI